MEPRSAQETYLENAAEAAISIFGVGSLDESIGTLLIVIPLFTYGMMVIVIVASLVFVRRLPLIHDAANGRPVVLSLERQHKYHLFLSHIWGSGQDQVATIKRQLCLLVPGVSIFLDVRSPCISSAPNGLPLTLIFRRRAPASSMDLIYRPE